MGIKGVESLVGMDTASLWGGVGWGGGRLKNACVEEGGEGKRGEFCFMGWRGRGWWCLQDPVQSSATPVLMF